MKVKALINMMNDYGTNPRIKVLRHTSEAAYIEYEGKPHNIDEKISQLKVNSFTVIGKGFIEIHTS